MKFILKETALDPLSSTPVQDYLKSLGISKVSSFMETPPSEDEESYNVLTNINKGMEMLDRVLQKDGKIFLQVDSDTDGYTSAAIIYDFIKTIKPDADLVFNIHPQKEHGVFLDDIDFDIDLVIVPDAGSNQAEVMRELQQRAEVLIIDHHIVDIDVSSDRVVVVNNQTSDFFENKSLSGAGMMYKFVQAYSNKYDLGDFYKKYLDLAAIGIIADSMDTRNLDNNYLIYNGLRNITNPLIKALLEIRAFSVSSTTLPNKIDIAFYVAPIINGLIRFGSMEEKEDFFYALANYDITETFERTWRGEVKVESFYQKVARESSNVKVKQDKSVNDLLPILQDRIESNGLDKNQIIICKTSKTNKDEVPQTVTGLVAMKLSVIYKRPVLVLRPVFRGDREIMYQGSGRASKADGFDSFKNFLSDSGLVEYAAGHDMAFGSGLRESNIEHLIEYANKTLKDVDFGSATIEADAYFEYTFPINFIRQFAEIADLYGNGIPQPKFVFDLIITGNDYSIIGKRGTTLKMENNGVSFISFRAGDFIEELNNKMSGSRMVRMVGRPELNVFNGKTSVQVQIDDLKVLEGEASLF